MKQSKLLLDPNPQADHFRFATARVFNWKDATNDIDWTGGLLLPSDYVPGRRYPLIVQTHGFKPDRFLLDGPADEGSTAFAAQAFASAGFVVLQIADNLKAFTEDEREGVLVAEGFHAGIESLIQQDLAERSQVGLIGFSRTGYQALHLLARYPSILAALDLSDSFQAGYVEYVLSATNKLDLAIQYERLTGGSPVAPDVAGWFRRNPLYALSKASAAVRLEESGGLAGLGLWETYTVLRQAQRPVEFVLFPEGSHVLRKPAERMASQGGNVDWFRFWLQGYEDPVAAKQEQYARWRALRLQRR